MMRKLMWAWLLFLLVVSLAVPSAGALTALVNPITLYQEAVKVENQIKSAENPAAVLPALDTLSDMYTRLDPSKISQKVEGIQAVTNELIALKQLYAAVKGPEQAVAEFRIHRIVVAFDSLAYPNSPAWLPVARSMENNLDKLIEAVAKGDQKLAKTVFQKFRNERDQIWLALTLHGNPSDLQVQASAFRFVEGQLAGEQVTDKQGTLDALGHYKGALGKLTSEIRVAGDPPLLPVFYVELGPATYGTACGGLLCWAGWRAWRKKKN
ncbi:sporulation protein YpjB [Tumebacillus permanentifrigoris]|uniref:Sporulation protein YpjB n=1 Tax=Tumebacillus permanentifrigoris TaxID=378543 RepID=A0A316DC46_9BACL|nr:sporulation protein YpjB [Tumebacillus permanentifrigoris]PWK15535.1 sporulation protein YpjB [Tumebacillus permanentifrigoris]